MMRTIEAFESATTQGESTHAASLLMVGISIPNYLESSRGPELRHDDLSGLESVRLPAEQITPLLHELLADGLTLEAWVLDTCNRFEVYAWVPFGTSRLSCRTACTEIKRRVFGDHKYPHSAINSLQNFDAIHHLLRTTMGLNSVLPGETDILGQVQTSLRMARAAKRSAERTVSLLTHVIDTASYLRRETAWNLYTPSYCSVMLERLGQEYDIDWGKQRVAVIGRSTTCASMLEELVAQRDVPSELITIVHKGSRRDGQIKKMRRLAPNAQKIRVESYDRAEVLTTVENCDLVVFGIDQRRAVLDGRSFNLHVAAEPRHRIVIDFNSFGSTVHLDEVKDMTLLDIGRIQELVAQYARTMCGDRIFMKVVADVEKKVEHCAQHLFDHFRASRNAAAIIPTTRDQPKRIAV